MEGLIPFIYKAIKERRQRSYSRCSSSSAISAFGARRAVHDDDLDDHVWDLPAPKEAGDGGEFHFHAERGAAATSHRRHRSLEELAGEVGASPTWRPGGALPRGRSVRIFSCMSGM